MRPPGVYWKGKKDVEEMDTESETERSASRQKKRPHSRFTVITGERAGSNSSIYRQDNVVARDLWFLFLSFVPSLEEKENAT